MVSKQQQQQIEERKDPLSREKVIHLR